MAKGSNGAVPATPARSGGSEPIPNMTTPNDYSDVVTGTERSATAERSVSFEDSADDRDANEEDEYAEDDEELEDKTPVQASDLHDDAEVFARKSGGERSLSRNLADEFEDADGPQPAQQDYDDFSDDLKPALKTTKGGTPRKGNRPPVNSDTPAVNKVLGQCLKIMLETSEWIQLFSPRPARQSVWTSLKEELSYPVDSTSASQVAEDTVSLLVAMGMETHAYPSLTALADLTPAEAVAELHKWKNKLRAAFGSKGIGAGRQPVARAAREAVNPANTPLPQPPRKSDSERRETFSEQGDSSPYFPDSHMVTPRSTHMVTARSASRTARVSMEARDRDTTTNTRRNSGRRPTRRAEFDDSSSEEDFDPFGFGDEEDDQAGELARQVRELSEMESQNVTPRIEVATHRQLAQIKPFHGDLEKGENSMQWLRAFVYEIKGTHTPPNEWCMAFQPSLRDGAVH